MALVELHVTKGIGWITLNRPAALNAMNLAMVRQLAAILAGLTLRQDVKVVVTRGSGRAFCAGSDLHELAPLSASAAAAAEREHARVFALLDNLPQPTIAAMHGYALGGGIFFSLYHDLRVAARSTRIGFPELKMGWTPPWGISRLVDVVGQPAARWLLLTDINLDADEAQSRGLIHQSVSDQELDAYLTTLARQMADLPTAGIQETKRLVNRIARVDGEHWEDEATLAFERCFGTVEARQQVDAFIARRPR